MSDWGWDIIEYFSHKSDEDLRMIWCPKCNKMLTNEYLRCNRCGEIFNESLIDRFKLIDSLEAQKQELYNHNSYREAIDIAYQIINISREIGDTPLEESQHEFIEHTLSKIKLKINEAEILARVKETHVQFNSYIEKGEIVEAHKVVVDFKKEFEDVREILLKVEDVKELIQKDKELWLLYLKEIEEAESIEVIEELVEPEESFEDLTLLIDELLKQSNEALMRGKLSIVYDKHKEIVNILNEVIS